MGGGSNKAAGAAGKGQRRGMTRAIGALTPSLTKTAIGKRGFTTAKIITDWSRIVGPELAGQSQPEQLRFSRGERDRGTLTIRVDGPLATELMHLEPQVVERINAHFGYQAVAKLKLLQAPMRQASGAAKKAPARPAPRTLSAEEEAGLDDRLAAVEDPELRESLRRLGRAVLRRKTATKPGQE